MECFVVGIIGDQSVSVNMFQEMPSGVSPIHRSPMPLSNILGHFLARKV